VCGDYANLMTAPIKFASWSEDQNAKITPKVDIVKK
jgi:hypothetical protein